MENNASINLEETERELCELYATDAGRALGAGIGAFGGSTALPGLAAGML